MCIPGQMVSGVICMRPSPGARVLATHRSVPQCTGHGLSWGHWRTEWVHTPFPCVLETPHRVYYCLRLTEEGTELEKANLIKPFLPRKGSACSGLLVGLTTGTASHFWTTSCSHAATPAKKARAVSPAPACPAGLQLHSLAIRPAARPPPSGRGYISLLSQPVCITPSLSGPTIYRAEPVPRYTAMSPSPSPRSKRKK